MEYPNITLPEPAGQQITLNLVNGLGVTGILEKVEYDDNVGLKQLSIRDQPDRDDLLHIRGDLLAIWRLGEPVPQAQPVPQGTILIPAGPLPGPNHRG
jgi:hypothetical protein